MRRESKKRAAQMRHFRILRDLYLQSHPRCEFPNCDEQGTDLHHKRGRVGADLIDADHFAALCRPHHRYLTEHPIEALALGLSEPRTGSRT